MSFYHKLAQHFLTLHFTEVNNTAEGKNQAYFGVAKYARSAGLSHEKQEKGRGANVELHDLSRDVIQEIFDDEQKWQTIDDCVKEVFDGVIAKYESEVADEIKKSGNNNSGDSVSAVLKAKELLEVIKRQCEDYDLWNEEYEDNEPIAIFQYGMLLYVCSRVRSTEQLAVDKIRVTKGMLKKISAFTLENKFADKGAEIEYVKGEITALINANKVVCSEHAKKRSLPAAVPGYHWATAITSVLGVSVSTSRGSSEGTLRILLDKIMTRIAKLSRGSHIQRARSTSVSQSIRRSSSSDKPHRTKESYSENGALTVRNWVERYQASETEDEKADIFVGATNLLHNDDLFRYAPYPLKNNDDMVFDAAIINPKTLKYVSNTLKGNKIFMLDLVKQVPKAYDFASARLKKNSEFQQASMSPFFTMMLRYQHAFGACLIGLAVAAVALAIALSCSLVMPAVIGIAASSALVTSTLSFFALRPAQSDVIFDEIEPDDFSMNL